jgi:hypothetical protein
VIFLEPEIISELFGTPKNDELLGYVARTIRDNPEIRKKVHTELEELEELESKNNE